MSDLKDELSKTLEKLENEPDETPSERLKRQIVQADDEDKGS